MIFSLLIIIALVIIFNMWGYKSPEKFSKHEVHALLLTFLIRYSSVSMTFPFLYETAPCGLSSFYILNLLVIPPFLSFFFSFFSIPDLISVVLNTLV